MPGEISAQLRHAQVAGAGIVLILALAILGFVWITIWATALVADWFNPTLAPLVVGLLCLAPLLIFVIRKQAKNELEQERSHSQHLELNQIAQAAHFEVF